jgi:hypothetical protein
MVVGHAFLTIISGSTSTLVLSFHVQLPMQFTAIDWYLYLVQSHLSWSLIPNFLGQLQGFLPPSPTLQIPSFAS